MADVEKDIVLRVKSETDQAQGQFKSLKQELRSIEQQLNQMAESGDTGSEAFRKLQQRAGQVKDQIGDTKTAIKALSSDTFKLDAFSQAAQGIAGGFAAAQGAMALFGTENKAVEEAIKKTQGAMALLQGVTAITNILQKESAFSLMFLGKAQTANTVATEGATVATKGFSKALIATGIGAIVVLIGTLVAYWDDLAEAVSGVSAETEQYLEKAKLDTESAQKKLQYTKDTENVMKLQGKSQREILKLKILEGDKVILTIKDQIKGQQLVNKQAIEGAKRNKDIALGILNFLTYPTKLLANYVDGFVNGLIETANFLGAGIDFRLNLGKGFEQIKEMGAELLFDPEKVQKEGDKALEEMNNTLTKMQNENAGFKLEVQKLDEEDAKKAEDARKKANEEAEKNAKEQRDFEDKERKLSLEADKKYLEDSLASDRLSYDKKLELIKEFYLNGTLSEKEYLDTINKLNKDQKDFEDQQNKLALEADRKYLNDRLESKRFSLEQEKTMLEEALLNGVITEKEYNDKLTAIEKEASDKRKEIKDKETQAQSQMIDLIGSGLGELSKLVGENTKAGKTFAIASTIIDTYQAAQKAYLGQLALTTPDAPIRASIAAGIAIAQGLARVKAISGIKIGKNATNSPSAPASGGGSIPSPSTQATQTSGLDSTQLQLDAQGNLLQQRTMRTYVLETDISAKQQRSKRLQQTATLGK